jgi:CHAT domain-containing protein
MAERLSPASFTSLRQQLQGPGPALIGGLSLAAEGGPDILTAEEVSDLDLSDCELVVISGCDAVVGPSPTGQGVASLHRALRVAGARSVITPLWDVDDRWKDQLLREFYRLLWKDKKAKSVALWEAKKAIRAHPDAGLKDWAGWILTGDPD